MVGVASVRYCRNSRVLTESGSNCVASSPAIISTEKADELANGAPNFTSTPSTK